MKSLEEVISTLERCTDWKAECKGCPYYEDNKGGLECELRNWEEVLHYLKQYRDKQKLIDTLRKDLMAEREMYAEALKGVK